MEIVSVRAEHIAALHAIYMAQVAAVPHCRFGPDVARFGASLLGEPTPAAPLFDTRPQLQTLVAEVGGTPLGFASFARYHHAEQGDRQAITALFFRDVQAGHALVEACEARATLAEIDAFPATHGKSPIDNYNAGWCGLSDRVPQVAQLLATHGYVPCSRELHLVAPLLAAQRPIGALPAGIHITLPDDAVTNDGMKRAARALAGEERVGVCEHSSLRLLADNAAAAQTGYIWWLHVQEAYRRRGLARTLMVTALNALSAQGCVDCWLTTAADNWGAQALYYTLGFAMVDCSVSLRKRRPI